MDNLVQNPRDIIPVKFYPGTSSTTSISAAEKANETPVPRDLRLDENNENHPFNWKPSKKWQNLGVISAMALMTPLGSSVFAPSAGLAMTEFHSDSTFLGSIFVSIYILGFAVGPLFAGPLSEIYGRRPVYLISNLLFVAFTIACARSTSIGMLIAFRFLAGCAGGTPVTIGGATVADMFPKAKRGAAMGLWGMGPLLGPTLGPLAGSYLAEAKGWRWTFWLETIISGCVLILGTVFLKETYAIVIQERIAKKCLQEEKTSPSAIGTATRGQILKLAIARPVKLLTLSPIVFLLSLFVGVVFGFFYLFITTFPRVFSEQYGFSTGATGFAYFGVGAGCLIGLISVGKTSDAIYVWQAAKNDGVAKPEFRLMAMLVSCPLFAIGLFVYGWTADVKTHWIVPILGTALFGIGLMPSVLSINMYIVDSYAEHSASALAAVKLLQSVGGAFLPLAGQPLYNRLGLGWGNSTLAFIAMALIPIPWIFFAYGEKLRNKFPIKL